MFVVVVNTLSIIISVESKKVLKITQMHRKIIQRWKWLEFGIKLQYPFHISLLWPFILFFFFSIIVYNLSQWRTSFLGLIYFVVINNYILEWTWYDYINSSSFPIIILDGLNYSGHSSLSYRQLLCDLRKKLKIKKMDVHTDRHKHSMNT